MRPTVHWDASACHFCRYIDHCTWVKMTRIRASFMVEMFVNLMLSIISTNLLDGSSYIILSLIYYFLRFIIYFLRFTM